MQRLWSMRWVLQLSIVSNTQPSMIHKKSHATQQMRPLSHETQPLVATGLAQHGFPPEVCRLLRAPQYAVRREVRSLLFQKTAPDKLSPSLPVPSLIQGSYRRL